MEKRRDFIRNISAGLAGIAFTGVSSGMSHRSYSRIIGANERINVALIGTGRRHRGYVGPIANRQNNVELSYLCDVMQSQREKALTTFSDSIGNKPALESDFRRVLSDPGVDAVIIATPDHWHTPLTCLALAAGKHVYVEKPCSHNPHETEIIVSSRNKHGKLVQMGNQYRSAPHFREIIGEIHKGVIGNTYQAICFYSNSRSAVDKPVKTQVPAGLDWGLFQGPAPRKDYIQNVWDYIWHWYGWDYGTGETGNNAIHELDIARWALQVELPVYVNVEAGKRHFPDDGWTMYDTIHVNYRFAEDKIISWDGKSRNGFHTYGSDRGTIVYGTDGTAFIDPKGYKVFDRLGKLQHEKTKIEDGDDGAIIHFANFFNGIRGKEKLNSPIETGVVSNLFINYANISYRIGQALEIDTVSRRIYGREAMALWSRDYEPGWEPVV